MQVTTELVTQVGWSLSSIIAYPARFALDQEDGFSLARVFKNCAVLGWLTESHSDSWVCDVNDVNVSSHPWRKIEKHHAGACQPFENTLEVLWRRCSQTSFLAFGWVASLKGRLRSLSIFTSEVTDDLAGLSVAQGNMEDSFWPNGRASPSLISPLGLTRSPQRQITNFKQFLFFSQLRQQGTLSSGSASTLLVCFHGGSSSQKSMPLLQEQCYLLCISRRTRCAGREGEGPAEQTQALIPSQPGPLIPSPGG